MELHSLACGNKALAPARYARTPTAFYDEADGTTCCGHSTEHAAVWLGMVKIAPGVGIHQRGLVVAVSGGLAYVQAARRGVASRTEKGGDPS